MLPSSEPPCKCSRIFFGRGTCVYGLVTPSPPSTTTLSSRSEPESCWCSSPCTACGLATRSAFFHAHAFWFRFCLLARWGFYNIYGASLPIFRKQDQAPLWGRFRLLSDRSCLSIGHGACACFGFFCRLRLGAGLLARPKPESCSCRRGRSARFCSLAF